MCFRVRGDFEEAECVIVRVVVQVQKQVGPTQEPGEVVCLVPWVMVTCAYMVIYNTCYHFICTCNHNPHLHITVVISLWRRSITCILRWDILL